MVAKPAERRSGGRQRVQPCLEVLQGPGARPLSRREFESPAIGVIHELADAPRDLRSDRLQRPPDDFRTDPRRTPERRARCSILGARLLKADRLGGAVTRRAPDRGKELLSRQRDPHRHVPREIASRTVRVGHQRLVACGGLVRLGAECLHGLIGDQLGAHEIRALGAELLHELLGIGNTVKALRQRFQVRIVGYPFVNHPHYQAAIAPGIARPV